VAPLLDGRPVDALEEDSFATVGDSGINMIRGMLNRNK
jgi:hypothetical protein